MLCYWTLQKRSVQQNCLWAVFDYLCPNTNHQPGQRISPLVFTMVVEEIMLDAQWVVRGEKIISVLTLTLIRAFMNDTTLSTTKPCTFQLLNKPQGNITWAPVK